MATAELTAARRQNSRFNGAGAYICRDCNKRTRETGYGESSVDLCAACYEEGGNENFCSDNCPNGGEDGHVTECAYA